MTGSGPPLYGWGGIYGGDHWYTRQRFPRGQRGGGWRRYQRSRWQRPHRRRPARSGWIDGEGRDIFDYNALADSTRLLSDRIEDFGRGVDRFDLRDIGVDFSFIGHGGFTGVAGQLRSVAGRVQGDVNGDRIADFQIVLENGVNVERGDFLL